jgi:hypothetical protein
MHARVVYMDLCVHATMKMHAWYTWICAWHACGDEDEDASMT